MNQPITIRYSLMSYSGPLFREGGRVFALWKRQRIAKFVYDSTSRSFEVTFIPPTTSTIQCLSQFFQVFLSRSFKLSLWDIVPWSLLVKRILFCLRINFLIFASVKFILFFFLGFQLHCYNSTNKQIDFFLPYIVIFHS